MLSIESPREGDQRTIRVVSGAGSISFEINGYIDAMIWDVPASETYAFTISGPSGAAYYTKTGLAGDTTVVISPAVPATGKMTVAVSGASDDGLFKFRPIGNFK